MKIPTCCCQAVGLRTINCIDTGRDVTGGVGVGADIRRVNVRALRDARERQALTEGRVAGEQLFQWPVPKGGSKGDGWLVIVARGECRSV